MTPVQHDHLFALLDAALDQPHPTPALRKALDIALRVFMHPARRRHAHTLVVERGSVRRLDTP